MNNMGMGGLFYPNVTPVVWIGTKVNTTITPATLTSVYTGNRAYKYVSGHSEMTFDVSYTTGTGETGTTLNIILETSDDTYGPAGDRATGSVVPTNWYQLTNEAASGGTSTLTQRVFAFVGGTGTTTYNFSYRVDITYKYIRLSVKETGVSSNAGTVFIEGVLGGN